MRLDDPIPDPENTPDDDEDVGLEPDDSVFEDFAQALEQLAGGE